MGWEEEITAMLQEVESETVRFDIDQALTETQQNRARNNIDIKTTATEIENGNYKIELHY